MDHSGKQFLVYFKSQTCDFGGHAVVHIINAESTAEAIRKYIAYMAGDSCNITDDSIIEDDVTYVHPLEYIETWYLPYGEWQIREIPNWIREVSLAEVFCSYADDSNTDTVHICRKELRKLYPNSRARAFTWNLRHGKLVSFYLKPRGNKIKVVARVLYDWDGHHETVTMWPYDYERLLSDLDTEVIRY